MDDRLNCSQAEALRGAGVIWNGDPLGPPVIPAQAGIQWEVHLALLLVGGKIQSEILRPPMTMADSE
jgi:hypothetical protein